MSLTADQIKYYEDNGYISPIDILSKDEANEIREEIEFIEKKWPNELEGLGRNYVHLISPVFDKICHNKKLLDDYKTLIIVKSCNIEYIKPAKLEDKLQIYSSIESFNKASFVFCKWSIDLSISCMADSNLLDARP